jgi:hypothetical protein
MIRVDEAWLSTEAMDMRAGMDTLLSRVYSATVVGLTPTEWAISR